MNEMQKCCSVSFKTVIYYVQLSESWFTCISMFFHSYCVPLQKQNKH